MGMSAADQKRIKDLHDERRKTLADARAMLDTAEKEKRSMSAEEQKRWDDSMRAVDELKDRVDKLEKMSQAEDEDDEEREEGDEEDAEKGKVGKGKKAEDEREETDDEEEDEEARSSSWKQRAKRAAKRGRRMTGAQKPGEQRAINLFRLPNEGAQAFADRQRRSKPEYLVAARRWMCGGMSAVMASAERRAIQADSDIVGGYLVMPQQFVAELIKFVDNLVFVRGLATKHTVANAQSLGAPSLDTDIADSDWTSELATGNEDTSMATGKRELFPHPLAKRIKVSNKLLALSVMQPEQLVKKRMGYKFGVTEEKAYMTGTGAQQPLGVFVASSMGIDTSRDVTCGTTTAFTADGLIDVKYNLKAQYQAVAEWILHRQSVQQIRKLKDGVGQYIWQAGLQGTPDTLLDCPVNMSEYAPNTYTTGQYVAMLGDWSFYWIADSINFELQRLVELYAETNQTGFIGRRETDGMPVLAEAFSRGKFA